MGRRKSQMRFKRLKLSSYVLKLFQKEYSSKSRSIRQQFIRQSRNFNCKSFKDLKRSEMLRESSIRDDRLMKQLVTRSPLSFVEKI